MRKIKCYLLILFLVSACGKHAPQFQAPPVKEDFGALISDRNIPFEKDLQPIHPQSYAQGQKITLSSATFLDLSHELMESGDSTLIQMGHDLIRFFYHLSSSSTQMTGATNPPESPYAETAQTVAWPLMMKKYDDAVTHVEGMVSDVAGHMSISVKDLGADPPPGQLIEKVIIGLKLFEEELLQSRDGTGDEIIEKISTSVDRKYISDLQSLEKAAALDPKIPLSTSLKSLEKSLTQLEEISEFDRSRLLLQVRYAQSLASQNEQIKSSDDTLGFLIDFWLAKDLRKNYPDSIKKIFENLSEAQIIALATENGSEIISRSGALGSPWSVLKDREDYNVLSDRQITALYLANNGEVLDGSHWESLKSDQKAKLDSLLINDKGASLFAKTMANIPSDDIAEERYSLVAGWLGLSGRLSFPLELRTLFSPLDESDLDLLGHNSSALIFIEGHIELSKVRYEILWALNDQRINDIRKLFNETITRRTREKVNGAMMPVVENLPTQIKKALIPLLEKSRKDEGSLALENYRDYGRYYLGKDLFGLPDLRKGDKTTENMDNALLRKHGLPLLESAEITFKHQGDGWSEESHNGISSAEVLGLGLVALSSRLQTFSPYEGASHLTAPMETAAMDLGFEAINKMLAIAGYRDLQNHLVESLSVSMTKGGENALFDIRNYDPTKTVFAVPDVVKITEGSFKLDPLSRVSPTVSVEGQMQLLRGYARMMGYFKPWKSTSFDQGLGTIRVDEDPTIKPFDRGDYFLLSLGLSVPILKNIPVKMLGLITADNHYVDATRKGSDPSQIDAVAAVMSDFTRTSLKDEVKTSSIATAIMAMADFYDELSDLELSTEPIITSALKQTPLDGIQKNIQKLISGLVLFSTRYLMVQDGGFYSTYNLTKMKAESTERNLDDQLLMEEALLTASRVLNSGFMAVKAVDNFFFLNNTMWDSRLGFYRLSEGEKKPIVRLLSVARAFKNVKEINQLLTQSSNGLTLQSRSSLAQMEKLLQLWVARFFTPEIRQLSPIYQVGDFSL